MNPPRSGASRTELTMRAAQWFYSPEISLHRISLPDNYILTRPGAFSSPLLRGRVYQDEARPRSNRNGILVPVPGTRDFRDKCEFGFNRKDVVLRE